MCLSPAPALFCIVGSPVCLNKATEGGEAVEGYEVAEDEDAISTESISSEKAINDHATTMKDAVATNDVAIADDSATEGDDSAIKRDIGKEQWIDNTCTWPGQERCGTLGTIVSATPRLDSHLY